MSEEEPVEPSEDWLLKESQARATIGLLVEDSQLIHIRGTTTAATAWRALQEYHKKSSLSSKVIMLKNLCKIKLSEDGNVEKHIINMCILRE